MRIVTESQKLNTNLTRIPQQLQEFRTSNFIQQKRQVQLSNEGDRGSRYNSLRRRMRDKSVTESLQQAPMVKEKGSR